MSLSPCPGAGTDRSRCPMSLPLAESKLDMLEILHGSGSTPDLHRIRMTPMAIIRIAMATKRPSVTRIRAPDFRRPMAQLPGPSTRSMSGNVVRSVLMWSFPHRSVSSSRITSLESVVRTVENIPNSTTRSGSRSVYRYSNRRLMIKGPRRL